MSDTTSSPEADRAAYQEAITEIGKGIALGLIPFLGQAIDIYDTLESLVCVHLAEGAEDSDAAKFDLMLAIIGWIPGPGDGIKKSLRLVNHNPDRFAPVLFDVLRFVMQECGIKSSPQALLEEAFNVGKIKASLGEIRTAITDSSTYHALPSTAQTAVIMGLSMVEAETPALVGLVERRLLHFKQKQHGSTAQATAQGKTKAPVPNSQDAAIAQKGTKREKHASSNDMDASVIAVDPLKELTANHMGVGGEHIADYYCLETFGWGKDNWAEHDKGKDGTWKQTPGAKRVGKLSNETKLYVLSEHPNPQGIDSVWRAEGNNQSKTYAIVEAKASVNEDAPKFVKERKLLNAKRQPKQPGINQKLDDNSENKKNTAAKARIKAAIEAQAKRLAAELDRSISAHPEKLLEPLDEGSGNDDNTNKTPVKKTKADKKKSSAGSPPPNKSAPVNKNQNTPTSDDEAKVYVQMSHEWITKNIANAVKNTTILRDFDKGGSKVYSRHLFFSPNYTNFTEKTGISEVDSPREHAVALKKIINKQPVHPSEHARHDCFHYDDDAIKKAVNLRKNKLRKVFGDIKTLKAEEA